MKTGHIFVETSLRWPKQGDGIVGIIFADVQRQNGRPLFGTVKDSTEHAAVLFGIKQALMYLEQFDVIHLHVSSNVGYNFKYLDKWRESDFKGSKGTEIKNADIWREIAEKSTGKRLEMHVNESNEYRNWLTNECAMRGRKHGFIP